MSATGIVRIAVALAVFPTLIGGGLASCGGEEPVDTEITVAAPPGADRLDPALASSPAAREALWLAYTPLLTYRHAEGEAGAELIPGLAGDLPQVSDDGRTYSLKLRDGLSYSDGTTVRAGDFEHAVERVLALRSPGAQLFGGIVGAERYAVDSGGAGGIEGIEADERTREITIRLTAPDADFAQALASTYAAPVPSATPFRDLSDDPPPGVGPYEIVSVQPRREFTLERAPGFAELDIPDIPTGDLATITARILPGAEARIEDVLAGRLDAYAGPVPAPLAPAAIDRAGDGFVAHPGVATSYFFLNRRVAPFDDPLVREAANLAVDRRRLAAIPPAPLSPGCSLLAPALPGYDEGLDTTRCPYGDPNRAPNLDSARALVERAGASGTGVTVWGPHGAGGSGLARAFARTLTAAGLDAEVRIVDGDALAAEIADPGSRAQTGLVQASPALPHPLALFEAAVGAAGPPAGRPGPADLADAHVRAELERLERLDDPDASADDWTALDDYLVSPPRGYVVVIGHPRPGTLLGGRLDPESAVYPPAYGNDYSRWRLAPGEDAR